QVLTCSPIAGSSSLAPHLLCFRLESRPDKDTRPLACPGVAPTSSSISSPSQSSKVPRNSPAPPQTNTRPPVVIQIPSLFLPSLTWPHRNAPLGQPFYIDSSQNVTPILDIDVEQCFSQTSRHCSAFTRKGRRATLTLALAILLCFFTSLDPRSRGRSTEPSPEYRRPWTAPDDVDLAFACAVLRGPILLQRRHRVVSTRARDQGRSHRGRAADQRDRTLNCTSRIVVSTNN
ncbi:hypothetical protein PTTW11_04485, partial [Pyrenophora teres f. teres]